jgi:hypothetical protein
VYVRSLAKVVSFDLIYAGVDLQVFDVAFYSNGFTCWCIYSWSVEPTEGQEKLGKFGVE